MVVKRLDAPYDAGRRGSGWVKVKPRHTLDLVVLGVEWGSGRRRGTLSNIHLGARDGDGFVMLGKTFKGMTDEMLAWQTERFLALETHREGHVVFVRPEQVVEIAFDGVQRSTRYPGGVALRFARVLRYRDDKPPAEVDTIARGPLPPGMRPTWPTARGRGATRWSSSAGGRPPGHPAPAPDVPPRRARWRRRSAPCRPASRPCHLPVPRLR